MAGKPMKASPRKLDSWEINDAMRTLQRAEEIKKDKLMMGGIKKTVADLSKMAYGGTTKSTPKKKK